MDLDRLPRSVHPLHYHIRLSGDIHSEEFKGICSIVLSAAGAVNENLDSITLHALGLDFTSVQLAILENDDIGERPEFRGNVVEIDGVEMNQEWEVARIKFKRSIRVAADTKMLLRVEYVGKFNKTMRGFYLSEWKGERIGTTQFEPTDARRAFPCWDEPSFKATFSIDIESPGREYQVISNMPVLKLCSEEGKLLYQFYKSPIMSTYLVAFVIGKFDYISRFTRGGVETRIYCMPGKINQAEFALDVAVKAMDFFVEFFGIEYPLVNSSGR
jgi:aminopeptidase N